MPLSNLENTFATTFHTVAQAPSGVARLRELILTLAVQGKLVAQDASDEPASALLKKIRAEKDRLMAEGKIKKDKPLAEVTEEEKLFELPVGWEVCRLGDIFLSIKSGGTPSKNNPSYWDGEIPWASVKDLKFGEPLKDTQDKITAEGLEAGSQLAVAGSILICTRMGLGKIGEALVDVAINQDLKAVQLGLGINKNYFINFFKTLSLTGSGMTVAGIKQDELLSLLLPLPPEQEQSRIVARVEELMRLCDALEEKGRLAHTQHQQLLQAMLDSLTQTTNAHELARHWQRLAQHFDLLIDRPEAVDALEQTILQLAVRGLLVEQKENEDPLQISSSNEALSTHNLNGPFGINIPKGWRIYSLLELGKISGGKTPSTQNNNYWDGDVPWITPKDMKFEILEGSLDKVTKEALKDGLTLYPADSVLMVVRSGILRRIFPVALSKVDFTVNQDLKVLVPDLKISEYLVLMLKGFEREILRDLTKIGTTVESIQFDKFSKFQFPIPPLAEQSRIVARVTELRALCQQLRGTLTQARTTQTQLAQAWVEQVAA